MEQQHWAYDVREVLECSQRHANYFLERGYRLLSVVQRREADRNVAGQLFIRQVPRYIVGRPEGVEHIDWPDRVGEATPGDGSSKSEAQAEAQA